MVGTVSQENLTEYVSNSHVCQKKVLPAIVNSKIKTYESSNSNQIRSICTLYKGGLLSKKEYTSKRTAGDNSIRDSEEPSCDEFMTGCKVPKLLPYKKLMSVINGIDIGEVKDLQDLATLWSLPTVAGSYRPLKPFLFKLADFYMHINKRTPCIHWFKDEVGVFYIAIGADGAPLGKDNTATGW